MSKKCVAFSKSKLGLETADNRKSFYAGWDAALAEQEEQRSDSERMEPVGRWDWNKAKFEWLTKFDYYKHHMTPLYAAPVEPVKQEPVAWMDLHKELGKLRWMGGDEGWDNAINAVRDRLIELATPQPVRTKDLTDVDLWNLWEKSDSNIEFARAVIAADREKNK